MIGTVELQTITLVGKLSAEGVLVGHLTTTLPNGLYENGYSDGHKNGYNEGLAARTHETWTITLVDGSVIEKDVALL